MAPLGVVLREWGRIGCLGFGGPPAHIALLRELCVERRAYLTATEFEDAVAACNLLPGPASTQLAIFTAWRVAGPAGALGGGLAFIVPGLVAMVALAALFLASDPPAWIRGAGLGAGAAVAAVGVGTGAALVPASRQRTPGARGLAYAVVGGAPAVLAGPWVVLALLGCGGIEVARRADAGATAAIAPFSPLFAAALGGLGALAWVAFKVGALSYGGGFVIVPLM